MRKYFFTIILSIFILLPFLVLAVLSFGRNWAYPFVLPATFTLDNWRTLLLAQSDLSQSVALSLFISISISAVVTLLSFFTSKFISFSRWRRRWLLIAYFPYVFPPVILAACVQYYFLRLGWAGSTGGVILAQLFITYPFGVIIFTGFWNERLRNMEQLVATLGGNTWQTYTRVLLPMAKGALLVCFFQTFLISWFEYGLTRLIGVGKVQTLTLKVFQYVNEANIFYAALASILLAMPPILLLWINKRFVFVKFN
jgi:putative spermidine/putrescine transport system permease protein